MANMSYCRFENTYHDLKDCVESLECKTDFRDLRGNEKIYAEKIIELCEEFLQLTKNT